MSLLSLTCALRSGSYETYRRLQQLDLHGIQMLSLLEIINRGMQTLSPHLLAAPVQGNVINEITK